MNNRLDLNKLIVQKANSNYLKSVKELLKEAGLDFWIPNDETYKNFYVVIDKNTNSTIGCFAIDFENKTGILKSFAIKKNLQGHGIGKYLVNEIPRLCKILNIEELFAASREAPSFWKKTIFKEIELSEIKNAYYLQYSEYLKIKAPEEFDETKIFYLKII